MRIVALPRGKQHMCCSWTGCECADKPQFNMHSPAQTTVSVSNYTYETEEKTALQTLLHV